MKIRSAKAKEGKRGGLLIKKLYSLIVAVILLLSLAGCTQATKTTMQPRLVKTVTEYNVDFETKEWIPVRTYDFTYENGYPVSIDVFEIGADLHTITNFAYTFENGIPTNRKTYNEEGTLLSETEYLNGRVYNVYEENEMGTDSLFYQYGNGTNISRWCCVMHEVLIWKWISLILRKRSIPLRLRYRMVC